jgi:hypothetical protein
VTKSFLQPTSPENPEGVRRMVAGWQAVEKQEREDRRQAGPDAAMAIRGALELMDLFGAMHGWPPPENEARRRDDELARRRWVRVRSFYQAHGQGPSKKILEALADLAKALQRIEAPAPHPHPAYLEAS